MSKTVRDWREWWIKKNGNIPTDDIEVIIERRVGKYGSITSDSDELYVGCFVGIDIRLLDKKVIEDASVLVSSEPERDGAYILYV